MPFTPLHWGPGLLIGLLAFPWLDLPCLLIASVIVDVEPLVLMMQGAPVLHAFFHTHLGATIAGLALSPIVYVSKGLLQALLRFFGLEQSTSSLKIVVTSLIGTNFHVFLDSFLYPEMHPLFPLVGNPFYGMLTSSQIYLFCIVGFAAAVPLYLFRMWRARSGQVSS